AGDAAGHARALTLARHRDARGVGRAGVAVGATVAAADRLVERDARLRGRRADARSIGRAAVRLLREAAELAIGARLEAAAAARLRRVGTLDDRVAARAVLAARALPGAGDGHAVLAQHVRRERTGAALLLGARAGRAARALVVDGDAGRVRAAAVRVGLAVAAADGHVLARAD